MSRKTRNKRNYPSLRSSKSRGTFSSAARPESRRSSSSDCREMGCCCSHSSNACSMTNSSWMVTGSRELVNYSPALCDADPSSSCWPYLRRSRVYASRATFCSSSLSCNRHIDTKHCKAPKSHCGDYPRSLVCPRLNESFATTLTPYRSRNAPTFFFGDDDDSDDGDAAPGNKRGTKCDEEN